MKLIFVKDIKESQAAKNKIKKKELQSLVSEKMGKMINKKISKLEKTK